MPTKCDTQCDDPLWCIQRKLCKKDAHPDRLSRSLMALRLELPQAVADSHEAIARAREAALCDETFGLIRAAYEVHAALTRLFRSCAPDCIPDENALHLINQLSNVIAGYRAAAEPKPACPATDMLRAAADILATSEPPSHRQMYASRLVSDWLSRMADGEVISYAPDAHET